MAAIYHVLNRGVDKRKIFLDDQDYLRFIHDLFEFNDVDPVNNVFYRFHPQNKAVGQPYFRGNQKRRELIVDILAFVLMPNHYHLLVRPRIEKGIPLFMKKLGGGYVQYFNQKHNRKGTLFESGYKSIRITNEAHFIHLPYYIHLNPLDLYMPEWRERKITSTRKAMKFLEEYRWSSFPDYIGKKNFPSVTSRNFLLKFFGGPQQYQKDTRRWLKDIDLSDIQSVALEKTI